MSSNVSNQNIRSHSTEPQVSAEHSLRKCVIGRVSSGACDQRVNMIVFEGKIHPHGIAGGVLTFPVIWSVSLEFRDYGEGKILREQKRVFAW